jgi:hypothetical protein
MGQLLQCDMACGAAGVAAHKVRDVKNAVGGSQTAARMLTLAGRMTAPDAPSSRRRPGPILLSGAQIAIDSGFSPE